MAMENYKKQIIRGMVFVIIVLALIFLVNALYWNITIIKTEEYRQEVEYQKFLSSGERKLDYTFFGDSHLMLGLDPHIIPNSFNFGTVGENYAITYYRLKRVVEEDGVDIATIVLPLDPHSFSSFFVEKKLQFPNLWLSSQYIPLREIAKFRNDSLPVLWLDTNFPFIGKGQFLMGDLIVKKSYHSSYRGWFNYSDNFSAMDRAEYAQRKYTQFYGGQEEITPLSLEYFKKTLSLAQNSNITIILVKFPHSREYDDLTKKNGRDMERYYSTLFRHANETLTQPYYFFDYYSLFFNNSDYLKDPDHVNYRGAEILSRTLYDDLQSRGLTLVGKA